MPVRSRLISCLGKHKLCLILQNLMGLTLSLMIWLIFKMLLVRWCNTKIVDKKKKIDNTGTNFNQIERWTPYGFFHPYCNTFSGGGEPLKRLWIMSSLFIYLYSRYPCITTRQILNGFNLTFDYRLDTSIYIRGGECLVTSISWSYFTLVWQVLGICHLDYRSNIEMSIWYIVWHCEVTPLGHLWVFRILGVPIIAYKYFPATCSNNYTIFKIYIYIYLIL